MTIQDGLHDRYVKVVKESYVGIVTALDNIYVYVVRHMNQNSVRL